MMFVWFRSPWVCLGLVAGLVAGLFYGGSQPVAVGLFTEPWDKVVHAGLFAVMATLLAMSRKTLSWRWLACCLLLTMLVGLLDEVHQHFLPGRSADVSDWVADSLGAGVALLVLKWAERRWVRIQKIQMQEVA